MGREMCCSMAAWGNLVRPLEAVLNNGLHLRRRPARAGMQPPRDAQEFEAEYFRQLDAMLTRVMENTNAHERVWKEINPSPLLSGTMRDCIESGRDVSDAGTRYNSSGVMCCGLGTVGRLSDGGEDAGGRPQTLHRRPARRSPASQLAGRRNPAAADAQTLAEVGQQPSEADAAGQRIVEFLAKKINRTPNTRGGTFQLGLWSIDHNFTFGKKCAATPGRTARRRTLLPQPRGLHRHGENGPLALMNSAASLDLAESPDGAVLDILLHPSAVSGPDGAKVIAGLVRGYFASGGLAMQFNIMDAEELREAQREPEKHSDVQVRVCGWNSRFIDLSPEEQNTFIRQAEAQE